jgi:hypothetical protein
MILPTRLVLNFWSLNFVLQALNFVLGALYFVRFRNSLVSVSEVIRAAQSSKLKVLSTKFKVQRPKTQKPH